MGSNMTDGNSVNRRSILKGVATGATLMAGATGAGTARGGKSPVSRVEHEAAIEGYADSRAVQAILAEHKDMLERLAAKGLVESASADGLFVNLDGDYRKDGHEQVTSVRRTDGTVTPEIKISRYVDGEVLTIGIRPETGVRWALQGDPDAEEPTVHEDVTTMACCSCCGYEKVCCDGCDCTECICKCEWCYECTCPSGCC